MLDLLFASYMLNKTPDLQADFSTQISAQELYVASLPNNLTGAEMPEISAQGAYVFDMDSASVLYEKSPKNILPIASLTKLMTALIAEKEKPLDELVIIPESSRREEVAYTKTLGLPVGGEFSVRDLLTGMLITSAGDAAETLAVDISGGNDNFTKNMNQTARDLDLQNTIFSDSFGMSEGDLSTAKDLSRLFTYVWRRDNLRQILSDDYEKICMEDNKNLCFPVRTTNLFLGKNGVIAGKTGTTDLAKECVILAMQTPKGKTIVITLLGSEERWTDAQKIINWLNNNFSI